MKISSLAVVAASILFLSSCTIRQVQNQTKSISVSGTGVVSVEPDQVTITMSVRTTNRDLLLSTQENAAKMQAVQQALLDSGLTKEDFATQNYNIYQESRWENNRQILGNYRVTNEIVATIHNVEQAGTIIDAAVKAGANEFSELNFSVSNTMQAVKQARILAIKQAEEAANLLASTSGAKIGSVITIKEDQVPSSGAVPLKNAVLTMSASDGASTSINAAKTNVSVTVHVEYSLQ